MEVMISTGEVIKYSMFGSVGSVNEEYIVIRKGESSIVKLLSDFNLCFSRRIEGTEYTVDYISVNIDAQTVWNEPLYRRYKDGFSRSLLGDNSVVIEINNQGMPRVDYNETDKPWTYFGVYGFNTDDTLRTSGGNGKYCDVFNEVFINAYYHFDEKDDFECIGAVNDVCGWLNEVAGLSRSLSERALKVINDLVTEAYQYQHRG